MLELFFEWTFTTWYNALIITFLFFNMLYWLSAAIALKLFAYLEQKHGLQKVDNHFLRKGQRQTEIVQSIRSIMIFSLQAIIIQQGLVQEWLQINYELNWWVVVQIILLFLWNEIHFYAIHYLMHTRWMMRKVHYVHHLSKEPTIYATFSFHWMEAFLLGTVMFFPLLFYPFQAVAIFSIPVFSIIINLLGHCNYDFFSKRKPSHLLKFSYRHSTHHKYGKGNLGFLLPWLDNLFKTNHLHD